MKYLQILKWVSCLYMVTTLLHRQHSCVHTVKAVCVHTVKAGLIWSYNDKCLATWFSVSINTVLSVSKFESHCALSTVANATLSSLVLQ